MRLETSSYNYGVPKGGTRQDSTPRIARTGSSPCFTYLLTLQKPPLTAKLTAKGLESSHFISVLISEMCRGIAVSARPRLLKRGHWTIGNSLHYVMDVTIGVDNSTLHYDNGSKIMAAFHNTVVSLLRHAGFSTLRLACATKCAS
jgi:hypothetical protein